MRILVDWVKSISIALVAWFLLRTFLIEAFRIPSGSMQNTLLIGDFLFVNKFLYGAEVPLLKSELPAVREPERGDIIVFDSVEEDLKVVKRLIGIAGRHARDAERRGVSQRSPISRSHTRSTASRRSPRTR